MTQPAQTTEETETERAAPSSSREPSLRERKFARTKLALLHAAVDKLRHKRLDEITVKELCEEVQVSEATFFNYFPKKDDLLHYFIQLWTIEVTAHARSAAGERAGVRYIESIFDYTGQKLAEHPRLMLEIISHMASAPRPPECERGWTDLTLSERQQAFPELEGCEDIPLTELPDIFRPALERAVAQQELSSSLDIDTALLALLSTFFGVPLLVGHADAPRIRERYERQLRLLWVGMRAGACRSQAAS